MRKIMRTTVWILILVTAGILVGRGILILKEDNGERGREILGKAYEAAGEVSSGSICRFSTFTAEDSPNTVQALLEKARSVLPHLERFFQPPAEETLIEDDETRDEVIEAVEAELKEQMIRENQAKMVQEENKQAKKEQEEAEQEKKKEETAAEKEVPVSAPVAEIAEDKLRNFNYLLNQFFVVDPNTTGEEAQLNYEVLTGVDCRMEKKDGGPQILIYHTHSQEGFADSAEGDSSTGVIGLGNYLEEILEKEYGYDVLHLTDEFDMAGGQLERSKAYNYAAPVLEETLKQYPSIEVIIDLHRDGVPEGKHLVTEIDGKQTAKIMFFNGLSRTRLNGVNESLPNPYIRENLGFSFQLEYMAKRYYPDFVRCVYLKGYRYNLHFRPKSLLLEVGAQTNTVEEARNAMKPFAHILDLVLQGENR